MGVWTTATRMAGKSGNALATKQSSLRFGRCQIATQSSFGNKRGNVSIKPTRPETLDQEAWLGLADDFIKLAVALEQAQRSR
jgi:hypothetical protein